MYCIWLHRVEKHPLKGCRRHSVQPCKCSMQPLHTQDLLIAYFYLFIICYLLVQDVRLRPHLSLCIHANILQDLLDL